MRFFLPQLAPLALVVLTVFACEEAAENGGPSGKAADRNADTSSGSEPSSSSGLPDGTQSGDAAAAPVYVDTTRETMQFGGRTRSYLLQKPKNAAAGKSYPLVVSFHGNPATADAQASALPFASVSKDAAVIAYPQAIDNNWDLYTPTDTNADMHFVEALISEIADNKASIDKSRVFGFGYSGGAFFISQMACRFGGLFKAISVNAGGGPDEEKMGYAKRDNGCYVCPAGPIPTLVTHGAADSEVLPESGEFTANCYAAQNGCSAGRSPTSPSPCTQYDGCPAGQPVKWCLVPGLNHSAWSEAMKQAWTFFGAF